MSELMIDRLVRALDKDPNLYLRHHLNNLIAVTIPEKEIIQKVVVNWFGDFSDYAFPEKLRQDIQVFLRLLEEDLPSLQKFKEDLFSIALACFYIERHGLPEGAGVRNWYKQALISLIEANSLGLVRGNLHFYYDAAVQWNWNEVIPIQKLYGVVQPYFNASAPIEIDHLMAFLDGQGILISIQPRQYRFNSRKVRAVIRNCGLEDLADSDSVAFSVAFQK